MKYKIGDRVRHYRNPTAYGYVLDSYYRPMFGEIPPKREMYIVHFDKEKSPRNLRMEELLPVRVLSASKD